MTERTRCYWLVFIKSHVPTDSCVLWAWRGPYGVELQQYGVEDAWGGRSLLRAETLPLELRILRFRSQFTSDQLLILWMFFSLPSPGFLICKVGSAMQWFPIGWCWLGSIRTLLGMYALVVLYLAPPAPQSYCPGVSVSTVFCIYPFILLERNKRSFSWGQFRGFPPSGLWVWKSGPPEFPWTEWNGAWPFMPVHLLD